MTEMRKVLMNLALQHSALENFEDLLTEFNIEANEYLASPSQFYLSSLLKLEKLSSKLQERSIPVKEINEVINALTVCHQIFPNERTAMQCSIFLKKLMLLQAMSTWEDNHVIATLNRYFPHVEGSLETELQKCYSTSIIVELKKTYVAVREFTLRLIICDSERQTFLMNQLVEEMTSTTIAAIDFVKDAVAMIKGYIEPSIITKVLVGNDCTAAPVSVCRLLKQFLKATSKENLREFMVLLKKHASSNCSKNCADELHRHLFDLLPSDSDSVNTCEGMATAPVSSQEASFSKLSTKRRKL